MTDLLLLFLQLAGTFFVIGLFTIGGGYAMLSLIQTQVVVEHAWLTESTFTDIVAISQMTPGPIGVNCATYVGYDVVAGMTGNHLLGILGSGVATLSLILPSFIIVLAIVRFYTKFRSSTLFEGVMGWLRPCVAGLIGAAAVILIVKTTWGASGPSFELVRENFPDWKSWLLLAGAFAASYWGKVNPILVILCGGLLGLLLY
ncbi:MAG: chromate transporter [Bacteroidales bacterium]|nr:chromate transporter [Bacteroidales bacterium]